MRHRREFVVPIDAESRNRTDRRDLALRRQVSASNRRMGASRRFDERRRRPGSWRILVVDGQETVRGGIRRVLGGAGHEVIEAHEGQAGLNYYYETPADAVVVNLSLPDMDGVEFIRQIRERSPSTKIIAIAPRQSYGAVDPLALATRLGGVHELRWPFGPDGLLQAVGNVFSSNN
jgi:DNA-binding response OmpR family regulator